MVYHESLSKQTGMHIITSNHFYGNMHVQPEQCKQLYDSMTMMPIADHTVQYHPLKIIGRAEGQELLGNTTRKSNIHH